MREFTGQCQCGHVRYQVRGEPLTLFACHCSECQKQSASAFGMALWVKDYQVVTLAGSLKTWTRTTPTGNQMECAFCPLCGSRVFHRLAHQPEILSIKPGTLDDTSWLKPAAHIWTRSAQPWIRFEPDTLACETNPGDFAALIAAWQRAGTRH